MYHWLQKNLTRLILLALIGALVGFLKKDQLPNHQQVDKSLLQPPVQRSVNQPNFQIEYKGSRYTVRPRASYDIRALVVSQNNPTGIADSYHDSRSLDTKDFCVIWGHNVRSSEYKTVKFWSGSWTCYCEWENGTRFWMDEFSNNHLITNNEDIRDKIASVGIGDQVHIKGMLVDYTEVGSNSWRNSSLTRTDTGNTACEVVFVEDLKILSASNRPWRGLFKNSLIALGSLLLLKFGVFWFAAPEIVSGLN